MLTFVPQWTTVGSTIRKNLPSLTTFLESTIITLGDWYHKPAPEISGTIAYADSTLINGKGRYPGGPLADLSIVNVEFGKRYRFRLISISCDPNFLFSIDGHSLTVIEADGESTKPLTVDRIQIFTGM